MRIGEADEEPALGGARLERRLNDGLDDVGEHPVRRPVARIELCVQPLRSRRKAARGCLRCDSTALARTARRRAYEGDDELVRKASLRAMDAELVRRREQLDERCLLAATEVMEQCLDAERVAEIGDELLVVVGQDDPARQSRLAGPLAEGVSTVGDALEVLPVEVPPSTGEDRPAAAHAREEGQGVERTPVPLKERDRPLPL